MPTQTTDYTLRAATPADFAYVAALNERSYRDVVERQFGTWNAAIQAENFGQKWRRGTYLLVLQEGRPVGAFLLEAQPDHLFLADIQIDAPTRGRGLGAAVLATLLAEARAKRLPLRLRVLHRNRARALYERLGFRQYGITDTHYLMEKAPDNA